MNPVLEAIHARRSQNPKFMTGPDLSQAELNVLAEAAAAAPDHGRLGPLRLAHITDRAALADAFAAAAVEADAAATPDDIAAARERAMAGPCLIAVLAHIQPDHPTVPAHEQWVAVGAGLQNLLLAVESLGLQAKMVSGRRVQSAAMRSAFGLSADENLVGFVAIGRSDAPAKPIQRRPAHEVQRDWPYKDQTESPGIKTRT